MRRLEININDESAAYLQAKAEREGVSLTEAQRRSYAVAKFIDDAWASGDEVIIRRRRKYWWSRTREYLITPRHY